VPQTPNPTNPNPTRMQSTLHTRTFRLNSLLFFTFLILAVGLGLSLPERVPVHFGLDGTPNRWSDQALGHWILLSSVATITFLQGHLFQRFVLSDPASSLLSVRRKKEFLALPVSRRVPVFRRANRLLGIVNTLILLLFSALLILIRFSGGGMERVGLAPVRAGLLALLVALVAIPALEGIALSRMVNRVLDEQPSSLKSPPNRELPHDA
jgi:uncharacterized membrane protein